MFKAIVSKETLSSALNPVSVLLDECKIRLNEDGLRIQAIDPATVAMVDISLGAGAFESYEANGGVIAVNLTRLEDIVGMADAGQLIHLELDEETRKLHISIGSLDYTLALIDPEAVRQEPDIPDFDLPALVVLEGRDINRAVKAAGMVADHVAFGVDADEEVFYVDAEGDTDDVHFELGGDDLIDLQPGDAHSLFSLDYLKEMNRAIPTDAAIEVTLGEEFPMFLDYDFAEGDGHIQYSLAPRITKN